jgi:hypothetical protein
MSKVIVTTHESRQLFFSCIGVGGVVNLIKYFSDGGTAPTRSMRSPVVPKYIQLTKVR